MGLPEAAAIAGLASSAIGAGTSIMGAFGGQGGGASRDQGIMSSQMSTMNSIYEIMMSQIQAGVAQSFANTQSKLALAAGDAEEQQLRFNVEQLEAAGRGEEIKGMRASQEERKAFTKAQGSARAQTAAAGVSLDQSGSFGDMMDAGAAEYRQAQDTIRYDTEWAVKNFKDQAVLSDYLADLSRWSGQTNSELIKAGGTWQAGSILSSGMARSAEALAGGMLSQTQSNIQADAADSARYGSLLTGLGRAAEYGLSSLKYIKTLKG
jgi:hypothetical protein